jgi:hypothetical protein
LSFSLWGVWHSPEHSLTSSPKCELYINSRWLFVFGVVIRCSGLKICLISQFYVELGFLYFITVKMVYCKSQTYFPLSFVLPIISIDESGITLFCFFKIRLLLS